MYNWNNSECCYGTQKQLQLEAMLMIPRMQAKASIPINSGQGNGTCLPHSELPRSANTPVDVKLMREAPQRRCAGAGIDSAGANDAPTKAGWGCTGRCCASLVAGCISTCVPGQVRHSSFAGPTTYRHPSYSFTLCVKYCNT